MKREYSSPVMEVEVFEASEYIASCFRTSGPGYVFKDNGETHGIFDKNDSYDTSDLCNKQHKNVEIPNNVISGFIDSSQKHPTYDDPNNPTATKVYYWKMESKYDKNCNGKSHAIITPSFSTPLASLITNAS